MSKRIIIFIVFNMLLVAGSLGFSLYAYRAAGRYFARDVIYVAPRLNEHHLHFSITDVDLLSLAHPSHTIAAVNRGSARIVASARAATATVIYTDSFYFGMHAMDFVEGSRPADGLNAIVVNQALAWRLFGNTENIVGLAVWIGDTPYVIAGVVRQDHEDRNIAWRARPARPGQYASALYIRPNITDPLTINQTRVMLTSHLQRRLSDYSVVDVNRYVESMGIRHSILLYMLWLCILILFIRMAWRRVIQAWPGLVSADTNAGLANRHNGFASSRTNKKSARFIIGLALPFAGVAVCMYFLMGINDILQWLPNLSDPHVSVFESISTVGMLPPVGYLPYGLSRLYTLSRHTNYAFIAGCIGLINLLFCLSFNERGN